jgi:enoyl-CoA hydratase/carnithine racemase
VIAVIEGATAGAELELALACDVRVASEAATFSMPQVASGTMPSLGGTQRLPRIAGRAVASSMILLGTVLDARAALACGLVNAATAPGAARARAMQIAESIAARGPLAVRYAKEAMLQGLDMPLEQALRYETDLTVILQTTSDRAEGVSAFLQKREARFRGE